MPTTPEKLMRVLARRKLSKTFERKAQIVELLEADPLPAYELAYRLGLPRTLLSPLLSDLIAEGLIIRSDDHRPIYSLATE